MNGQDPIGPRRPVTYTTVTVREELARFALAMEAKLAKNDHKLHWREVSAFYLRGRLKDELRELESAMVSAGSATLGFYAANVQDESVDVANFAMMIFDLSKEGKR